jgi:hypothetical protein
MSLFLISTKALVSIQFGSITESLPLLGLACSDDYCKVEVNYYSALTVSCKAPSSQYQETTSLWDNCLAQNSHEIISSTITETFKRTKIELQTSCFLTTEQSRKFLQ